MASLKKKKKSWKHSVCAECNKALNRVQKDAQCKMSVLWGTICLIVNATHYRMVPASAVLQVLLCNQGVFSLNLGLNASHLLGQI